MSENDSTINNLPTLNIAVSEVLRKSVRPLLMYEIHAQLNEQGYRALKTSVSQTLSRHKGTMYHKFPNGAWTLQSKHSKFNELYVVKQPKKGTITAYIYDVVREHQPIDFAVLKEILYQPKHENQMAALTANAQRYIRYHVIAHLNTCKQYFKKNSDGKWSTTDV